MAECGICLDVLRNPVSVPCGHVHCERCLRAHIGTGADALKSTCPTCRKSFYIATPDFTFVPQKYHDFMLPSVRKVYMDIPSVAATKMEVAALAQRLEAFTKENEHLRQRCAEQRRRLEIAETEKRTVMEQEEGARQEVADLRKRYDSLKKRYRETQTCDDACDATQSHYLSRKSSQNFDNPREILPKVEEHPVSLQGLNSNPARPKRALPKSRLSMGLRRMDETVKRQRTHRHSDVGHSSQLLEIFKGEEEEEGEEET